MAGLVKAVGEGVDPVSVGRPGARPRGGARMAEEVAVDAAAADAIPDAMPFDEAAALHHDLRHRYHALKDRAHLKAGETLLVLGAAGGVGLAAVELGKAMGARSSPPPPPRRRSSCARHGADGGVVYGRAIRQRRPAALAELFKDADRPATART